MKPSIRVVADPRGRRARLFLAAAASHGARCEVIECARTLDDPEALVRSAAPATLLRLESIGESPGLRRALLHLGQGDAEQDGACRVVSRREVDDCPDGALDLLAPRQLHLGYRRWLTRLEEVARGSTARWLTSPAAVLALFDKQETAQRLSAHGVAVPEGGIATDPDELLSRLREGPDGDHFLKLRSGSSASGLALLRVRGGRLWAHSTLVTRGGHRFNSLRLARYADGRRLHDLVDFLVGEGARVERAVDKARVAGWHTDLRVLVVAGEPAFLVLRESRHPITNLHLGNRRGDAEAFARAVHPEVWSGAMGQVATASKVFGAFHLGVDLAFTRDLSRSVVIEANAFGDLLPGLTRNGLDVYGWELLALDGWLSERADLADPRRGDQASTCASGGAFVA